MSKYNILIVEDELIPANYLKKVLEQYGYIVVGIADSKENIIEYTYKKDLHIDLVLMDIRLKGLKDGIEIAKYLQSYLSIAILFISAYSDMEYLERAKNIDAIGYLVKPIQPDTLLSTIEVGMSQFKTNLPKSIIPLCEGVIFDAKHQIIKTEQETINLTFQESIVLKILLSNRNNITTIEEIEYVFFQAELLTEGALRTTIWRLRKKLPDCIHIETIYKSGYKIKN